MVRDVVEHISDSTPRRNGVDGNFLVAAILGEDAYERVNGAFGTRVQGVLWHAEILGRVGRHQDDTPTVVQMAVCLASHEELTSGVEANNTVKFLLHTIYAVREISLGMVMPEAQDSNYLRYFSNMSETDNPGIAAHNIKSAKVSHGIVHQLNRLSDLADISLESNSVRAKALDLADNFLCRLARIRIVDNDFGTQTAELGCNGSTNPAARACDQGDFPIKPVWNVRGRHICGRAG